MSGNEILDEDEQAPSVQGDDLGRIFEVGFNTGVLTIIAQQSLSHPLGQFYQEELKRFKFGKIVSRLIVKYDVINPEYQRLLRTWATDYFRRGWLAGRAFFQDYLQAIGWTKNEAITVMYLQAQYRGDNSLGETTDDPTHRSLLSFFGPEIEAQAPQIASIYTKQGEFLKADTLLLLRYTPSSRRTQYRILVVDESIFFVRQMQDLRDVTKIDEVRALLQTEERYLRSKSVFSRLAIDTGEETFSFPESLSRYFAAFKRGDKESAKMIQAGSYAYSFYQFLTKTARMLPQEEQRVLFNVVGYSDRGMSTLAVDLKNLDVLKACYTIYHEHDRTRDGERTRTDVLEIIKRNAAKSFGTLGRQLIDGIGTTATTAAKVLPGAITGQEQQIVIPYTFDEEITGFASTASDLSPEQVELLGFPQSEAPISLQDAHADLIEKALSDPTKLYLFLTGAAGVGKTTAMKGDLEQHIDEGFLFIYVSPRKQVNRDIVKKFQERKTGRLISDKLWMVTSHSALIKEHGPGCVVEYRSNTQQGDFLQHGVRFVQADALDENEAKSPTQGIDHFRRTTDDTLHVKEQGNSGVLRSLCQGLYTLLDQGNASCIVATVSIQSLKKIETMNGEIDTMMHFKTIFKNIMDRDGELNGANLRKLRQRMKHIFFMIDEITGDESGVEFLGGIGDLLTDYGLTDPQYGFNTKIIVADASLVGSEVITQHLKKRQVEPDKIFFQRTTKIDPAPLTSQSYTFIQPDDAVVINANSYPASSLRLHYHIAIGHPPAPKKGGRPPNEVVKLQQGQIEDTIVTFMQRNAVQDQLIVYIQNKSRLFQLIDRVGKRLMKEKETDDMDEVWLRGRDYLEIHADISREEQLRIEASQETAHVIFMTASASRGLSFPYARHILVDVPRFDIAKNLMEIVQVVYRSRGNRMRDLAPKDVTFYLSEYVSPEEENRDQSIQGCILNLLTMLLLLKLSLMTRIQGSGSMGTDRVRVIPLGGKGISTAAATFSESMEDLLNALIKEQQRRRYDDRLREIYSAFLGLLQNAETQVRQERKARNTQAILSASVQQALATEPFYQRIEAGLLPLLSGPLIEPIHVSGGLLIIPLAESTVSDSYQFRLAHEIMTYANEKLKNELLYVLYQKAIYTDRLRSAIRQALDLVEQINQEQVTRTQFVQQASRSSDRYLVIPQSILTSGAVFKEYFQEVNEQRKKEHEDLFWEDGFRDLLGRSIRALYPVETVLPITSNYEDIPFLIIRSYSLKETRHKMFTNRYLLTSNTFNILNMLLSKDE